MRQNNRADCFWTDASCKGYIIPLSNATSITTVNILSDLFSRFGLPEHLVTDNNTQLLSNEYKSFTRSNGIKHTFSPPDHTATNGFAERMVKTFKSAMKSSKHDKGTLHAKLDRCLLSYRNAHHSTTNEIPATLMFGRCLPLLHLIRPDITSKVTANL
ncbi:polyprotein [Plakobranchus ocellatus]|uniref:Polyprotein n=1 Tax=Plakobranchus ocellatus TaxID=259542 RepID=A0AAV3XWU6_9GAST|nr:polyprotein [Plakobranchus ocellatus]